MATDPGAVVTLAIGGATVALAPTQNGSVWNNRSPISLTAGVLAPVELTITSVRNTVSLSWSSLGLGSQVIPASYLYSATLVDRLRTSYVRFLKATSLAATLSLTADEIAELGTASRNRVNTIDSRDSTIPGNVVFTPASMTNIVTGMPLVLDSGAAAETIAVTATTATTFSATTTLPHNGTVQPFAIYHPFVTEIGMGWLNFLAVSEPLGQDEAANLGDVLMGVLNFARVKAALSPKDGRFLAVLQTRTQAGSHRFPGDPSHAFAPVQDPGRTDDPHPDGVVDAAPAQPTAKAPAIIISRLLTRLRHLDVRISRIRFFTREFRSRWRRGRRP